MAAASTYTRKAALNARRKAQLEVGAIFKFVLVLLMAGLIYYFVHNVIVFSFQLETATQEDLEHAFLHQFLYSPAVADTNFLEQELRPLDAGKLDYVQNSLLGRIDCAAQPGLEGCINFGVNDYFIVISVEDPDKVWKFNNSALAASFEPTFTRAVAVRDGDRARIGKLEFKVQVVE